MALTALFNRPPQPKRRKLTMAHCLLPFRHPLLLACFQAANDLGFELVLVGGAVRDVLLKVENTLPEDLDFLVLNGDIRTMAEPFAQNLNHQLTLARFPRPVVLDADWGIIRLVVWWQNQCFTVDLANALNNDLHTDLHRRDVTLNAIGWTGQQFIDPTGGRRDLAQGVVRQINAQNFADDPLRVLRVFRTAAGLPKASITPDTLASCHHYAQGLTTVAKERMLTEWLKLLNAPTQRVISLLATIPPAVLHPFVASNPETVCHQLAMWQRVQTPWLVDLLAETQGMLHGHPALAWMTWLALDTKAYIRYPVSRDAAQLCKQWPTVAQILNPFDTEHTPTQIARWQSWHNAVPGALLLWALNHPEADLNSLQPYAQAWQRFRQLEVSLPPLVDGRIIIDQWKVPAGPGVQKALQTVRQAQLAGLIETPAQAYAYWQNHQM